MPNVEIRMPNKRSAWLQLLRLPNLLTVPGDPLVGYWLAGGASSDKLPLVLIASLFFYAGGLITNDLADVQIDSAERPKRPLPSGRIKKNHAMAVAVIFFLVAETLCFIDVKTAGFGLLLMGSILSYNFFTKKWRAIDPHLSSSPLKGEERGEGFIQNIVASINMGLCRGLNVLLGASLVGLSMKIMMVAALFTFFIAVVTHLARHEAKSEKMQKKIGLLISMLIPLQALFIAVSGHGIIACLWLALWPLHRLCSKSFYAS